MFMPSKRIFSFILSFLIGAGILFLSSAYFMEKELLLKKYVFIGGGLVIGSIMFLINRQSICWDRLTIGIFFFVSFLFVGNVVTSQMMNGLSLMGFWAIFLFFKVKDLPVRIVDLAFVLLVVLQTFYGILQYTHIINLDSPFPIIGSYDNPAGFAACLSVTCPLAFSLFDSSKGFTKNIAVVIIGLMLITVILSGSRAGIVSMGVTMFVCFYWRKRVGVADKNKIFLIFSILVGIGLFIVLFLIKKDSALGRLLIWQVAWNMIKDNPLGGGGGTFIANYMRYQADFFRLHADSDYILLADNIFHPFNEYLLLVIDYGVLSILILVLIIRILCFTRKSYYFYCLLSIGIFSLFSYPFRYPFVWLVTAYCLAQLTKENEAYLCIKPLFQRCFQIVLGVLMLIGIVGLSKDFWFEYTWSRARHLLSMNKIEQSMDEYRRLCLWTPSKNLFLYNYGSELNRLQKYELSNEVLNKCSQNWSDYYVEMLLADNYFNLQQWDQAEEHFKQAGYMCPNRFFPPYQLHEIYCLTDRPEEAIRIARELIKKEVKVESAIVYSIKKRMEKYIAIP